MKKLILGLILTSFLILFQTEQLSADSDKKEHVKEENHDHNEKESQEHKNENHEDHKDGDEHDDHEEEEESSSAVGPDKGILEKGENGFKLSSEATKSFELKVQNISSHTSEYPRATLVEVKSEQFIYRLRDGWIKKTAVKVIKKNKDTVILEISLIKAGDKVIVEGTGFVRVSELVAEEGVSHGHSH